jgi:hypothetical protein
VKDAHREVIDRLTERIEQCDHIQTVLREVNDWIEHSGVALYDPVTDQFAIRLPGSLIRRLSELSHP